MSRLIRRRIVTASSALGWVMLLGASAAQAQLGLFRVTGAGGVQAESNMHDAAFAANTLDMAFSTSSRNLGLDPGSGASQILLMDLGTDALSLISRAPNGDGSNGNSTGPALSANGRYVVFSSFASNLVSGEQPPSQSVFRFDRQTLTMQRVSVSTSGGAINAQARYASISDDGRYVAYFSSASNQISGDSNGAVDLLLTDMQTMSTTRLSLSDSEQQAADGALESPTESLSGDARYAVFTSNSNLAASPSNGGNVQIYLRDRTAASTTMVSVNASNQAANSQCDSPSISRNGRYVVYRSFATNLVSGATSRIFRRDLQSGSLTAIPLPASAASCETPQVNDLGEVMYACSENVGGTLQAWLFRDPNLLFLLSPASGTAVASNAGVVPGRRGMRPDGALMAYSSIASNIVSGDTNGVGDIFVVVDSERLSRLFGDGFE